MNVIPDMICKVRCTMLRAVQEDTGSSSITRMQDAIFLVWQSNPPPGETQVDRIATQAVVTTNLDLFYF